MQPRGAGAPAHRRGLIGEHGVERHAGAQPVAQFGAVLQHQLQRVEALLVMAEHFAAQRAGQFPGALVERRQGLPQGRRGRLRIQARDVGEQQRHLVLVVALRVAVHIGVQRPHRGDQRQHLVAQPAAKTGVAAQPGGIEQGVLALGLQRHATGDQRLAAPLQGGPVKPAGGAVRHQADQRHQLFPALLQVGAPGGLGPHQHAHQAHTENAQADLRDPRHRHGERLVRLQHRRHADDQSTVTGQHKSVGAEVAQQAGAQGAQAQPHRQSEEKQGV